MFNPQVAQRQNGRVTLYLSTKYPPPPVPFELQGHISADDWAVRIPALTNLAAKYYKPVLERVWLVMAIIITLLIPVTTYMPLYRAMYGSDGSGKGFVPRFIGVLLFFAALALFWLPIFIWKRIGKRRVNALLAKYAAADAARPRFNSDLSGSDFVPKWSVNTPGVFTSQIILTITTPPVDPVSSFHPDAYLPAYIGRAEETQGAYFYPYPNEKQGEGGLPRMSVVGGGYYAANVNEKV
jgi:hypothetical protein